MRIVVDTNTWHPLLRKFIIIAIVVFVVNFSFQTLEYFLDIGELKWWRGYILGFIIGIISVKQQ